MAERRRMAKVPHNPADVFRPVVDEINGVDVSMMISNLRLSPADRLRNNTIAAINIARLRNAARRGR
jgi:hypothetical protein